MNIKEAKEYIKSSVRLYLKKDEFGEYRVPVVRQRPIFLLGAPGIGKTAIMEQIAQEMGLALVAYSMTHHTRQSALGLPFITQKKYGDKEYQVSEYTMSEIIASVYDTMENSGIKEGILFLDEINCVSETLAPSMLQFLQYKVFGRHQVPEGWVIVTAGNPPEFNKSVREFDVVTMDRLKLLEVEADYEIWKEYARERQIHSGILTYLDLKKDHFYVMEMTTSGRSYVTARGWEDLSEMLYLYEQEGLEVEESLIGQYLHNDKVIREFAAYYELYQKYKRDYKVAEILQGKASERAVERAKAAGFDERLSLLGMLVEYVQADMKSVMDQMKVLQELKAPLQKLSECKDSDELVVAIEKLAEARRTLFTSLQTANSLSDDEKRKHKNIILFFETCLKTLKQSGTGSYDTVKNQYNEMVKNLQSKTKEVKDELHHLFAFVENVFGEGNEMLILVTELTVGTVSAGFIAAFGSEDYAVHSKELMLNERQQDIKKQIDLIEI